jgi:anti-anti-sigma factor
MRNVGDPGFFWTTEGFFMDDLFRRREGRGPVYADSHLVVTRTHDPYGLRLAGEIDVSNSDVVAESMRLTMGESEHPHLDLSGLSFSDVSGIRALVELAQSLGDGRRLLLHGLPRQLRTIMQVTGWSNLPTLSLCKCGGVKD